VEFGLTIPVLLGILAAVIDYGWYLGTGSAVLNAVKDGVRLGVSAHYGEDPRPLATQAALDILTSSNLPCDSDCTVAATIEDRSGYQVLTLLVQRPYQAPIGLVPTPAQNGAAFEMLLEHQDLSWYGF